MFLESAKIDNFKSIGRENNILHVENSVTALIGTNESGKSNILEAIGRLNQLLSPLDTSYLKLLTRGQEGAPQISLRFSFSPEDIKKFSSAKGVTTIVYTDTTVSVSGGFS